MAKSIYIGGADNKAHKVKKLYIGGTDNKARKVKKVYIGDANGKARLAWNFGSVKEILHWDAGYNNTYLTRTDDFINFSSVLSDNTGLNDVAYRQGYLYRVNSISAGGYTRTTKIQRKKFGEDTWTDYYNLFTSTDVAVFLTYNLYEDAFTLTAITDFYRYGRGENAGDMPVKIMKVIGINFSTGVWVNAYTDFVNPSYYFSDIKTYSANNVYYLGVHYTYGAYSFYRRLCSNGGTSFTNLSDSYPLTMLNMIYYKERYYGNGYTNNSYRCYSFKIAEGSNYPNSIIEIASGDNNMQGHMGDDSNRFYIVDGVLYLIVFRYTTSAKTNTINIYKSTDGTTFTQINTVTQSIFPDTYGIRMYSMGEDSDNWYYGIFTTISNTRNTVFATISKTNFGVSFSNTTTAIGGNTLWGQTEG